MPGPSVFPATNRKQHSGGERKTKPNVFKNGQYPGVAGFAILLSSPPLPFPIPLPFPHRFLWYFLMSVRRCRCASLIIYPPSSFEQNSEYVGVKKNSSTVYYLH